MVQLDDINNKLLIAKQIFDESTFEKLKNSVFSEFFWKTKKHLIVSD